MQIDNEIIVISGFSGAGKDTIAKDINKLFGHNFVISYSTRPMRQNEEEGNPYYFIDDNKMCTMAFNNELIEGRCYNTIHGNWFYAVNKNQILDNEKYVIVLDILGYEEFKKHFGNRVYGIFIDVPSEERLSRAMSRGDFNFNEWNRRYEDDSSQFTDERIKNNYNVVIGNIDYKETIKNISYIITSITTENC